MGQITPDKDVDGLYLHHVLMSPSYKKYIKSLSEGANINNLKFKDLSEFVVGYPSLSEQRSIVTRLDAAFSHIDALKANAEKQLNEARKLFSLFGIKLIRAVGDNVSIIVIRKFCINFYCYCWIKIS
jgi:type I restriction enzyme S subunit